MIQTLEEINPKIADCAALLKHLVEKSHLAESEFYRLKALKDSGANPARQVRVAAIAAGQEPPDSPLLADQVGSAFQTWKEHEAAAEILSRELHGLKLDAGRTLCKTLKPKHDEIVARLFEALKNAHASHVEYWTMRQYLIDNEIGLHGIFDLRPDKFLGPAFLRTSDLGDFFRDTAKTGFGKAPKEFA